MSWCGAPWLPLPRTGYARRDSQVGCRRWLIAGIGFIEGTRCMVVTGDSDAGAIQPGGLDKMLRVQEMALAERLPHSPGRERGADLMRYRVEGFVIGGSLFRNLARLSAAGIPGDHGGSTAPARRAAPTCRAVGHRHHGRGRSRAFPPARRCSRPPPARWRPRRNWAAR